MPRDLICLVCPNGCHLVNKLEPDGTVQVAGNRCDKGLAFARSVHQGEGARHFVSARPRPSYGDGTLKEIASFWGVSFTKSCPAFIPDGSPERTLFRVVIEDDKGDLFVLEEIPERAFHVKTRIVKTLDHLKGRGMSKVQPYLCGPQGDHIQLYQHGLWQIVPFSHGEKLDRRTYLYDGWRAEVLSRFLIDLRASSEGIPFFRLDEKFSVKTYIHALKHTIERRRPELASRVGAVVSFLENDFMSVHDDLPAAFCHGDLHPLNIIWRKDDIEAVIDWEFLGIKPEIYDLSNMIGCLGIEHPSSLVGDLVVGLVGRMRSSGIYSDMSWKYLLEFVLAMRFAWLSEWLRKEDEEMVALELDYMELLMENRDHLRQTWGCA